MCEIIPAILAKSVNDLKLKFSQIPKELEFVHIDVLEEDVWTDTKLNFEVHLMLREPEKVVARWVGRGAKRIIVHSLNNQTTKLTGIEIGLGVEVNTLLDKIFPLIQQVDFVHLMSIDDIGTQGDDFEPIIFDRIKKVRENFPQITISVDGGINITNYQALESSGANRLIVGSGFQELWKSLTKN